MKATLAVAGFALLLSALALGLVLQGPAAPIVREAGPPAVEQVALAGQVAALQAENRRMGERIALLEARPAADQRAPVLDEFVTRTELREFGEGLRSELGAQGAPGAEAKNLKEQVADSLSEIRKQESIESLRKYQENRLAHVDDVLAKIEPWLQLAPGQTRALRTALLASYEREAEQLRLWERGTDPKLLAERKLSDQETLRTDLGAILTPAQFDLYWPVATKGSN